MLAPMKTRHAAPSRHAPPGSRHLWAWNRGGMTLVLVCVLLLWISGLAVRSIPQDVLFAGPPWLAAARLAAHVVHGVAAWSATLLAGRWVWPHLAQVLRRWRARPAGTATLAAGGLLAASGIALGYAPLDWSMPLANLHWWLGLLWPAALLMHAGRRLRPRRAPGG